MRDLRKLWFAFLLLVCIALRASAALAAPILTQTIDLGAWQGTPVQATNYPLPATFTDSPLFLPVPQPPPGTAFSLTGIAVDPVINTIYVADHASSNVYLIDGATNVVNAATYTYGFFGNIDGVPPALDGAAGAVVTTVIANPVTNRWLFMGEFGGAQFNGTTFAENVVGQALPSGGAWDPVTNNVYGATGAALWVTQGLKWLNFALSSCNATALNPMTLRVYTSCILGYTGSGLSQIPNYGIIGVDGGSPNMQARIGRGTPYPASWYTLQNANGQPTGLAVNPNTNRLYVATATSPTSLDVIDLSTNTIVASIPGLPDQSSAVLLEGFHYVPLPRQIAINTVTNTIFVVNSISSTISVFDGNTNTLTGTITVPVPDGAVVSVAYPDPFVWLQDIKTGNTIVDFAARTLSSLGGVIGIAVNESTNTLYAANVNGTVNVYALDAPAAATTFSVNGVITDIAGVIQPGVTVTATGLNGTAAAVTDSLGLFVLTGLTGGNYTITAAAPGFSFDSQQVTVSGANIGRLTLIAHPPIVPTSYTLSPWTTIGAGVTTIGTVTLNQAAAAGGQVVALSSSDPKPAKFPATVTVPAGQSSVSFTVQGNGVSATTSVTLKAASNGGSASTLLTVAPGDSLKVTKATWSRSSQLLLVTGTSTNATATILVQDGKTNATLGTMVNLGNGSYSFQQTIAVSPSSVNIISNLGGKTGQGVAIIP